MSAVFARDPIPSTVFFRTSRINGALTDLLSNFLLFCVGRINSSSIAMDPDEFAQANRSDSLLPQAGWSSYVKHCIANGESAL